LRDQSSDPWRLAPRRGRLPHLADRCRNRAQTVFSETLTTAASIEIGVAPTDLRQTDNSNEFDRERKARALGRHPASLRASGSMP